MTKTLIISGTLLLGLGLLWVGQGAGFILWPDSSFMLLQTQWIYYGAATAALGMALFLFGIFKRTKR
jgi:uncharacterized membrane protein